MTGDGRRRWVLVGVRWLLNLYPRRFRAAFGDDLLITWKDYLDAAPTNWRLVRCLMGTVGAAAQAHWDEFIDGRGSRRPTVLVLPLLAAAMLFASHALVVGVASQGLSSLAALPAARLAASRRAVMEHRRETARRALQSPRVEEQIAAVFTVTSEDRINPWPSAVRNEGLARLSELAGDAAELNRLAPEWRVAVVLACARVRDCDWKSPLARAEVLDKGNAATWLASAAAWSERGNDEIKVQEALARARVASHYDSPNQELLEVWMEVHRARPFHPAWWHAPVAGPDAYSYDEMSLHQPLLTRACATFVHFRTRPDCLGIATRWRFDADDAHARDHLASLLWREAGISKPPALMLPFVSALFEEWTVTGSNQPLLEQLKAEGEVGLLRSRQGQ